MAQAHDTDQAMVDADMVSHQDGAMANTQLRFDSADALVELDPRARAAYNIKIAPLPTFVGYRPSLETLYYNAAANLPQVPSDLSHEVYLQNFDELAAHSFAAKQGPETTQSLLHTRLIWFYGLDAAQSFSAMYPQLRYNVLALIYLSGSDFPTPLCPPAAKAMLSAYLDAWHAALIPTSSPDTRFAAQESFIRVWKHAPFDLTPFTHRQRKVFTQNMSYLRDRRLPPTLADVVAQQPGEIMALRREGRIGDEEWETHGPSLSQAWYGAMRDLNANSPTGGAFLAKTDCARIVTETARAEEAARSLDGNALAHVPWTSPLLTTLLESVRDPTMQMRKMMQDKYRMATGTPWMGAEEMAGFIYGWKARKDVEGG